MGADPLADLCSAHVEKAARIHRASIFSDVTIPSSHPRTALVVSHPGHELRVHGWLERTKPVVHVLTDGSGHTGSSRLDSTTRLLERVGARAGSIYGRYSDESLYALLRRGAFDEFFELAQDLAAALVRDG